ncbi:enoyl-ACP reductase [PVC group bacterium (ex Bugula neritina AB1)]|nr:enoyl-ACP reductase [PVC group bacterium (ex Bugula neritina AB1)]
MLLEGKKGVIVGVANKRSIAWGIAKSLSREGATLALTCQTEKVKKKVEALVESENLQHSIHICDATNPSQMKESFNKIGEDFGNIDFLTHSIAFAQKEDLDGSFVDTSEDGFDLAMKVSTYTLTSLTRAALPWMKNGGSIIALSYLGAEKVIPGYNVMGVAKAALEASVRYLAFDLGKKNIRVNAISAGPVNTLAARGIAHFTDMLKAAQNRAPLGRNTTIEEVGDTALYLTSELGRGVTGEVIHVDNGLHLLAQ